MEEKFFLPIFHTLPKSNKWTRTELFKQLQHEYRALRDHNFEDFMKVWNLLLGAQMVIERQGVLAFTRKGRHIARLNYPTFTLKHLEFHQEHGEEYMVRFTEDNGNETRKFFENLFTTNLENFIIALIFAGIVLSLSVFMGKGVMNTVFDASLNKIENELDQNMNKQLDQVDHSFQQNNK